MFFGCEENEIDSAHATNIIELHAPTNSTQKLKLIGKGGQFTYTPTNIYRKHQIQKASKDIFATKWVHFRVRQAENWPPFCTISFSNSFRSTDQTKKTKASIIEGDR
jgi:hypothetical protein